MGTTKGKSRRRFAPGSLPSLELVGPDSLDQLVGAADALQRGADSLHGAAERLAMDLFRLQGEIDPLARGVDQFEPDVAFGAPTAPLPGKPRGEDLQSPVLSAPALVLAQPHRHGRILRRDKVPK